MGNVVSRARSKDRDSLIRHVGVKPWYTAKEIKRLDKEADGVEKRFSAAVAAHKAVSLHERYLNAEKAELLEDRHEIEMYQDKTEKLDAMERLEEVYEILYHDLATAAIHKEEATEELFAALEARLSWFEEHPGYIEFKRYGEVDLY